MLTVKGNKRPVESFLVANASDNLYNVAGGGNNITNPTGLAVRLANKQLGIFSAGGPGSVAANVATDATPVVGEASRIYIAQGTEYSANPGARPGARYPLWNRPYERSGDINGANPVVITRKAYAAPTHSTWVINGNDGLVAQDNTEYAISIAYRGLRSDIYNSPEGTAIFKPHFTTPDYTTLQTAEPEDHLLQNLAWNINRNSKTLAFPNSRYRGNEPVVAFAIAKTGSAGTLIGGGAPITAGTVISVVNSNVGVRNITLTSAQAESIKAAALAEAGGVIANLTWRILTVDLATAGTATGGVADTLMILALDEDLAYEDRIPQVKIRLEVALTRGFDFNAVRHLQRVRAFEGTGESRVWDLMYRATHGQRKYMLDHTMDPVIEFPSPIDLTLNYTSYVIEHVNYQTVDTSNTVDAPQKTIILVPTANTTLITSLNTALNSWLTSANGSVIIA
jgi:hypothetical protein